MRTKSRALKSRRRFSVHSIPTIFRSCNYGNRRSFKYLGPALPAWDLQHIIRTHQPNKRGLRKALAQLAQRIRRIAASQMPFNIRHIDARMARGKAGRFHPVFQRRHPRCCFQRILGRDHPPHRIQPQPLQCDQAELQMAVVSGVEGPAQQADPPRFTAGSDRRQR